MFVKFIENLDSTKWLFPDSICNWFLSKFTLAIDSFCISSDVKEKLIESLILYSLSPSAAFLETTFASTELVILPPILAPGKDSSNLILLNTVSAPLSWPVPSTLYDTVPLPLFFHPWFLLVSNIAVLMAPFLSVYVGSVFVILIVS